MIQIALYKPEIPPNTGNISRLCVGINAPLHIIGKPAFDISEKAVRRAGLDHWEKLALKLHDSWEDFYSNLPNKDRIFLITKFGKKIYSEINFQKDDILVFGSETSGLPDFIHDSISGERKLKIPMLNESVRSLNL
ncbi:MAG: tRNA (cytidine(34)-2'-O)-methyltransferase, partial [Leptospiraceae bacterium]|nr:tRNA (cytidine(34)-2'-O)-methyltransferase [Leptospiraceae bacterium]